MFLFLVVCAFETVRIVILLTLCCSLVGVVLWFTFAHVGTEIRRGERGLTSWNVLFDNK